ncbi:hypothetical protein B0H13DRAFT_1901412 [Mycena leptocephala]|nr:hypothetical protein B0H13DRAFT_1901412 [Mycena leptocephala]
MSRVDHVPRRTTELGVPSRPRLLIFASWSFGGGVGSGGESAHPFCESLSASRTSYVGFSAATSRNVDGGRRRGGGGAGGNTESNEWRETGVVAGQRPIQGPRGDGMSEEGAWRPNHPAGTTLCFNVLTWVLVAKLGVERKEEVGGGAGRVKGGDGVEDGGYTHWARRWRAIDEREDAGGILQGEEGEECSRARDVRGHATLEGEREGQARWEDMVEEEREQYC